MPRPGTPVIPANWSEYHRPAVEATMTAQAELLRPPSGVDRSFDEATGRSVYPDPATLWSGAARIQRISRRGGEKEQGARFETVQFYQVSLPADAPEPHINDNVQITAAADDAALAGKLLRVVEVRLGSLIWSRDLMCDEVTPVRR